MNLNAGELRTITMTQTETKTKAGKFIQKVLKPIIRGAVKQIPIIGGPIAEIVTNITTPAGEPKKHTNLSIIVQCVISGVIILDIILNKGENLKEIFSFVLSYLK